MLVCSVSLRPPLRTIAADIAEATTAADALATGNVVFATLVDDPASVGEIVDAYLGSIMLEAASAADTVDAGGTVGTIPWTPASLATLRGWYKADTLAGTDGSNLSTWPDSSGLGNDGTIAGSSGVSPTLQTAEQNSLNVVQIGGSSGGDKWFDLPFLLSVTDTAAAAVFVAKTNSTGFGPVIKTGIDTSGTHYPYSDNVVYDDFGSNVRQATGGVSGLTSWHIGSFHSITGSWKYYKNGVSIYTTSSNTFKFRVPGYNQPAIGVNVSNTSYVGMIGEIIIVNEFLSDSDRQKIEGYLAWKWGLVSSLDVSHPYKTAAP